MSNTEFKDGIPRSLEFDDIYFSRHDGLAESRHVFLQGNGLPDSWRDQQQFTIAETGFGTGLNFLATWQLWSAAAPARARLHYISVEKYPLDATEMARSHDIFPELSDYSNQLLSVYPDNYPGFHRLHLDGYRIFLTLCFGEVADMLSQLTASVDCWYLDGFAPAKNPAMWSEQTCRQIARLSHHGTTLATFTAAGAVRRRLAEQGFAVTKQPGFAHKRDMTTARMEQPPAIYQAEPWYLPPVTSHRDRSALVIGAGIAGAQCAWHLAIRGWKVTVIDSNSQPGTLASGNPVAVIAPLVTAMPSPEESFSVQCYLAQLRQLAVLPLDDQDYALCGVLQLAISAERQKRWRRLQQRAPGSALIQCVDALRATELADITVNENAIWIPAAGWIRPAALIASLLAHPSIKVRLATEVTALARSDGQWMATTSQGPANQSAAIAIIATGWPASLTESSDLSITPVRGQTSRAEAGETSSRLRCIIQHQGYITPAVDGSHLLGATYERGRTKTRLKPRADRENMSALMHNLPQLASDLGTISSAHAAIRVTTENRLPIVGPAPNGELLTTHFPTLRGRVTAAAVEQSIHHPGLFLANGFGSRGITNAALCGEQIAALADGEPLPLQRSLSHAIHPARALVKKLKQQF